MIARLVMCVVLVGAAACKTKEQPAADSAAPAASTPAASTPTPSNDRTATLDGLGKVKIGASAAELASALGEPLPPPRVAEVSCRYMRPASLPAGVGIMLVNDSVARIDIDSAGVQTSEGAGVGEAEARVVEIYRDRVAVTPHKYTGPTGHYLTVSPVGDTLRRIIFETDGQRVTKYRVGRRPTVEWVEGCS
jgi:hypothetical protein